MWELDTQFATMGNEIKDLGGLEFIQGAGQSQQREGYSISDFFPPPLHLGGVAPPPAPWCRAPPCATVGPVPRVWIRGGAPVPLRQGPEGVAGTHAAHLADRCRHRCDPLQQPSGSTRRVEGNGGHYQANTEIRAIHNQGTSQVVLRRDDPELITYRAFENDATANYQAGFLRLREISASYNVPDAFAQRLRARRALGERGNAECDDALDGGTWLGHLPGRLHPGCRWAVGENDHLGPEVRSNGQLSTGYQTVLPPTASFTAPLRLSF